MSTTRKNHSTGTAQVDNEVAGALSEMIPRVYDELRRLANIYLRKERPGHTLQPTALVHELYLKLVDKKLSYYDRAHFLATCARIMRQVLVDHARTRKRIKRGGEHYRIEIDSRVSPMDLCEFDILELHEAIEKLTELDPRQGKVVEMRFFAGLNVSEIANVLEVSKRTVEGDWQHAKAWLRTALQESAA